MSPRTMTGTTSTTSCTRSPTCLSRAAWPKQQPSPPSSSVARGARASTLYPWSTRDSITRLNPLLPIALRSGDWARVESLVAAAKPPASLPNLQSLADLPHRLRARHAKREPERSRSRPDSAPPSSTLSFGESLSRSISDAAAEKAKPKEKSPAHQSEAGQSIPTYPCC